MRSLWLDEALAGEEDAPPLEGDIRADVCIVGGGFTGLWTALRLKEREQKLLKKIDDALDRVAAHTYGICLRCGEEIPYKRLKARPVTTLCIECKTQQEREEKIRR